MDDEAVDWEDVDLPSNDLEWFAMKLWARIACTLDILALCQVPMTDTVWKNMEEELNTLTGLEEEIEA